MKKKYYSNSEGFINIDNLELLFAYVKQNVGWEKRKLFPPS